MNWVGGNVFLAFKCYRVWEGGGVPLFFLLVSSFIFYKEFWMSEGNENLVLMCAYR